MKKRLLSSLILAGALTVSSVPFNVLAHDELGDVNIEKGERAGYSNVAVPIMEGSKNLQFLHEAAAPEMETVRADGKQNSFADVYAHKGYAYLGTHTRNGGNDE